MRESVMLIEDDEDIRNSLKEILEDVAAPETARGSNVIDLMAALKKSVSGTPAPAKKPAAKKAPAKKAAPARKRA